MKSTWNQIRLLCGNHGDDYSHEMFIQEGPHSLFYACPEYKSIYGKDHSGRSCNNRLTLVDYEKLIAKLKELSAPTEGGTELNLTGYEFKMKGVTYKVLSHKHDKFEVVMLNHKAIA